MKKEKLYSIRNLLKREFKKAKVNAKTLSIKPKTGEIMNSFSSKSLI